MKIKISYTKYRNSPLATFWSGLGSILAYFLIPAGLLLVVWGGVHFDLHGFSAVLWGIICIIVTILVIVGGIRFCEAMEMNCLQKTFKEINTVLTSDPENLTLKNDLNSTFGTPFLQADLQNMVHFEIPEGNEKIQNLICPFCGKDIPSTSSYCCFCGRDISTHDDLQMASSFTDPDWTLKTCPSCKSAIPFFMVYCSICGKYQR